MNQYLKKARVVNEQLVNDRMKGILSSHNNELLLKDQKIQQQEKQLEDEDEAISGLKEDLLEKQKDHYVTANYYKNFI